MSEIEVGNVLVIDLDGRHQKVLVTDVIQHPQCLTYEGLDDQNRRLTFYDDQVVPDRQYLTSRSVEHAWSTELSSDLALLGLAIALGLFLNGWLSGWLK